MSKKVLERLGNTKSRTLIVLGGIILVVIGLAVLLISKKADPLQTQQSQSSKVPQITAIPGNVTSEKYQELQEEDNRKRAEEAKKSGSSAVATIIGTRDKDALHRAESLGIEDQFNKCPDCKCSGGEDSNVVVCPPNPELALEQAGNNKEALKKLLSDCPAMAKDLMKKNPALFKQLILENPALAKKIANASPELMKKLLLEDPEYAKQLARTSPEALKALMRDDPDFVEQMAKKNPELIKDLMKADPAFAAVITKNNPALVKKFLLEDPEFAKTFAKNNPDALKNLMKNDPEFTNKFGKKYPTLLKVLMKNDPDFAALIEKQNPDLVKELIANDPEFGRALIANKSRSPFAADKERALSADELRRKQKEDIAKRARQQQLSEQQQKQIAALLTGMDAQAKDAQKTWEVIGVQQYTAGEAAQEKQNPEEGEGTGEGGTGNGNGGGAASGKVLIKAGAILFAVLDTAVNTDEPGPIMGTIISGEFKGAKILGEVQQISSTSGNRPERVMLNFSTLTRDDLPQSITIKAVAVDPDTARTALASDVDHHYLLRYGSLFASSFLTGYAKVIASQGTVQTNTSSGSTTTTTPPLSGRQQMFAALGEVGKKVGDATATYFNTPNTITVNSGAGFGLLILSDVSAS